jgi:hypothetical protein
LNETFRCSAYIPTSLFKNAQQFLTTGYSKKIWVAPPDLPPFAVKNLSTFHFFFLFLAKNNKSSILEGILVKILLPSALARQLINN